MIIIGAGMAGCLAGVLNPGSLILEAASELPDTHNAVLRFRNNAISKVTGIPFKKVKVHKTIWSDNKDRTPTPRLINLYSRKVSNKPMSRSISNIDPVERFIAPSNFHQILADNCNIQYNSMVDSISSDLIRLKDGTDIYRSNTLVVSTAPISVNAFVTGHGKVETSFLPIMTSRYSLDSDSYCTAYFPDLEYGMYRASLTGNHLILESMDDITLDEVDIACDALGISNADISVVNENHQQRYGKIAPIDNNYRRNLVYQMTTNNGLYSLGRFATWRNILLDDVLDDIYVIKRLSEQDHYERAKHI